MVAADRYLDRQGKVDAERAEALRSVAAKEEGLAARRLAVEIAERREGAWQAEVKETLKGTWLEEGIAGTGLGSVLDQLSELSKALQDRESVRIRIRKMEADRTAFAEEVARLGAQAGKPASDEAPEQVSVRLTERWEQAERAREARANLLLDVQKLQDVREALNAEIAAHETTKQEVLDAFGVKTLPQVAERDEQLRERDSLQSTVAELEERLTSDLALDDAAQARSLLESVDLDGLAIEKAEIERRLADLNDSLQQQLVRRTRATDKLDAIGGDSAVARIDADCRTASRDRGEGRPPYRIETWGDVGGERAPGLSRTSPLWNDEPGLRRLRADHARPVHRFGDAAGKGGEVLIATQRDGHRRSRTLCRKARVFSSTWLYASPDITSLPSSGRLFRSSPTTSWRPSTISGPRKFSAYSAKWLAWAR